MKQLPKLNLIDFDYDLPNERIAYTPCQNRADSQLLVWDKQIIVDSQYQNISDFIPAHSTLLFNNSKVIAARILFDKQVDERTATLSNQNKKIQIKKRMYRQLEIVPLKYFVWNQVWNIALCK